jgi:thiol-disulfide isomerase/thioredoxin
MRHFRHGLSRSGPTRTAGLSSGYAESADGGDDNSMLPMKLLPPHADKPSSPHKIAKLAFSRFGVNRLIRALLGRHWQPWQRRDLGMGNIGDVSSVALLLSTISIGAEAAEPTVEQVLARRPVQSGVVCDTPTRETWDKCKLEAIRTPHSGWALVDARGLVVRKIVDTNGDGTADRWSYFVNGQEVYRDGDSNGNGRVDQCRWYHAGGSRWGIDRNEDGRIDSWRAISASEATAEAVAALLANDVARLRAVVVDENDLSHLGADAKCSERVRQVQQHLADRFQATASKLPTGAHWVRMDGQPPIAVPGDEVGASKDPVIIHNATLIVEAGKQTIFLRAAEVVQVGDAWKLTDVPTLIDPNHAVETAGVLIPVAPQISVTTNVGFQAAEQMIEDNAEIRKLAETLQQLDAAAPPETRQGAELVDYHRRRADLCARIAAKSQKKNARQYWYEQCADSLNAAAQTGEDPKAIEMLRQYAVEFAKYDWGRDLAAYFQYRAINSAYARELENEAGDHAKAQEAFLGQLASFIKDFPDAEDSPDAFWQLGNGMEFLSKEDAAKEYYRRLSSQFPKTPAGIKGTGALRRLESVGQPFRLSGNSLMGQGEIDSSRYRGKVLLVSYWATWCEPCKAEFPRLQKLRDKYADQGFEILGVCLDGDLQAGRRYISNNRYSWPQLFEEGSMESEPALRYGIISLPYLMLIDAEGRVIDNNLQFHQLERELERAIGAKSGK